MADAIQNISGPTGEPVPNRETEARGYRETEAGRADARDLAPLRNRNNGEEDTLKNPDTGELSYAANSTKGMPHDELGEVVVSESSTVKKKAYEFLLDAVDSELPADFAEIPTGPNGRVFTSIRSTPRPFVDPQNGRGLALEGPDAPSAAVYRGTDGNGNLVKDRIALVPAFPTKHLAAEIGEIYLMALSRDVPVNQLQGMASTDTRVSDAVRLMNGFTDYRGPVDAVTKKVTPQTLFRGGNVLSQKGSSANVGELEGPYVSQFMLVGSRVDGAPPPQLSGGETGKADGSAATGITLRRDQGQVVYGTLTIDQKQFEVQTGLDFVTDYDRWLQILQGVRPDDPLLSRVEQTQFTGQRKFRYSLRQMAEYVHFDQTYQEGLIAALLILSMGERATRTNQRLFNDGNVYLGVPNQTGFGSFGNGHVLALLAEATTRAVKAAWDQKWFNHRRLRPEVLGGRIHNTATAKVLETRYGLDRQITGLGNTAPGKEILAKVATHNAAQNAANGRPADKSLLLPQQYPEGSPTHPSYPAGHATQIAAEVTVLKGLFNEDFRITDPFTGQIDPTKDYALVPNADGTALDVFTPAQGQPNEPLTLGGELNKLAANVSLARSLAGVHYRLDYTESVLLGEYVGLGILQEQAMSFNQARRPALSSINGPFFFELTLFSGVKVRVLASGEIVVV